MEAQLSASDLQDPPVTIEVINIDEDSSDEEDLVEFKIGESQIFTQQQRPLDSQEGPNSRNARGIGIKSKTAARNSPQNSFSRPSSIMKPRDGSMLGGSTIQIQGT